MTATAQAPGAEAPADRSGAGPGAAPRTAGPAGPRPAEVLTAGPSLRDFVTAPDHRLRDLLAFGMAVEAGRPLGPDGAEGMRRQAEADLQAHAFRVLHNQVEAIRRQAMEEQMARMSRGQSFVRLVLANLVALILAGVIAFVAWTAEPGLASYVTDTLAQFLAQFSARP